MKNRTLIAGVLVLTFALAINWFMDESEKPVPAVRRNDPDFYMLNAAIEQFNEAGELQHRLSAARFTHFPLTRVTAMQQPAISLGKAPSGKDEPPAPWEITANEGRVLTASRYREEVVEFWNNVLAARSGAAGRFIHIRTDSLTVYPDRNYAETDARVHIDHQQGRTTAAGMQAYLDTGRFVFSASEQDRVTTIFLPNQR